MTSYRVRISFLKVPLGLSNGNQHSAPVTKRGENVRDHKAGSQYGGESLFNRTPKADLKAFSELFFIVFGKLSRLTRRTPSLVEICGGITSFLWN